MLKDHKALAPVRLEPAALRSRVKHSTTEPLHSLFLKVFFEKDDFEILWSADNLCKQLGSRSQPTKHQSTSGFKLFDTLKVFLKDFFEKDNFEIYRPLITLSNSLDPDQDRQNVRPDLDSNCLTL